MVMDKDDLCGRCGVNKKAPGSSTCSITECWLLDP